MGVSLRTGCRFDYTPVNVGVYCLRDVNCNFIRKFNFRAASITVYVKNFMFCHSFLLFGLCALQ